MVDAVVFRNTGPVVYYQKEYDRLLAGKSVVYNSLTGQADMQGRQYIDNFKRSLQEAIVRKVKK